jgi:hypothetical protein
MIPEPLNSAANLTREIGSLANAGRPKNSVFCGDRMVAGADAVQSLFDVTLVRDQLPPDPLGRSYRGKLSNRQQPAALVPKWRNSDASA